MGRRLGDYVIKMGSTLREAVGGLPLNVLERLLRVVVPPLRPVRRTQTTENFLPESLSRSSPQTRVKTRV